MTTEANNVNPKKRDDELLMWLIVGVLFTGALIGVDFGYSSFESMSTLAIICMWVGHGILSVAWIISLVKWEDPNYDVVRKFVVGLSLILGLIVCIHHALNVEDIQVQIDSKENAIKQ